MFTRILLIAPSDMSSASDSFYAMIIWRLTKMHYLLTYTFTCHL